MQRRAIAAPYQNYDEGTFLSDLVTRPEFLAYVQEEVYNRCQWIQSGVVTRNSALDCRAGGTRVRVPFYRPMVENEEQIRSDATWGESKKGYLTPKNITAGEQIMTIIHRGGAYATDDLASMGSGAGDPLAAIRSYLANCILKLRTSTLLAQMEGIFGAALSDNVLDVSQSTTGAAEANFLTASNIVKAQAKLGERGDDLTTIAMHSNVAYYLRSVGALTFSTSALATGGEITWGAGGIGLQSTEVAYMMGMRVVVDDLLKPTINAKNPDNEGEAGADQYPIYLYGQGSVSEGVQRDFFTESDRNILSKQSVMSWTHDYGFHLMGTSWKNADDNPTNEKDPDDPSDTNFLSRAANWECVYGASGTGNAGDGQKLVPAVKMIVNSPLAANV